MFMGPCVAKVFSSTTNKMQRYKIYLFLWNALHVSGGSSAHHQELKNCIYSIAYFVKPLLLPSPVWKRRNWQWQGAVNIWQSTRCCIYSFGAPDDGRWNRLKPVEHFTEINNLWNVASCWLYLKIRLRCTDPWTSKLYNVTLWHIGVTVWNVETWHFVPCVYCWRTDVSVGDVITTEIVAVEA